MVDWVLQEYDIASLLPNGQQNIVSTHITGLNPNTEYVFQIIAQNQHSSTSADVVSIVTKGTYNRKYSIPESWHMQIVKTMSLAFHVYISPY